MSEFLNQASMAAGEIGPELYGRVDQDLYYIGLRTCRNFYIKREGGASNRPGTRFVSESKDSAHKTRVIPFQFNDIQTYSIELGHQYMRIIKSGAEVLETAATKTITAITQANPGVFTSAAHGFANGDDVYISGVVGMTELNGRTARVANQTTNTFTLTDFQGVNINTTAYAAYTSGGTAARVYTVATPWTEDALFDLNFAQSADVLTVVHPSYPVRDVTRTAHDAWTVSTFVPQQGPFKDINVTGTTVAISATTGAITVSASVPLFTTDDVGSLMYIEQDSADQTKTWEVAKAVAPGGIRRAGFNYYLAIGAGGTTGTVKPDHTEGTATDGDNGVLWQYLHSGFGIVQITGFTNTQAVSATVLKRLPDNLTSVASANWAKAAWSITQGYPGAVAYHKQRLIFGGTVNAPNNLWMSGVGARTFFGKSNPILDDESITLALDTTEVNAVRHLLSLSDLIVLTSSSEQLVNGKDNSLLASEPPVAKVQGYSGSSKVRPIIIQNTAIFVQDMGSVVRSLQYNLDTDSFTGIDLTARSPHLFRNKSIVDWSFQKHPLSVIWCIMSDGGLNGFTFMQEQKVYAWHRHDTDGTFESVCSIREGNETATYLVTRRLVNGTYRRYTERFASRTFSTIEDAFFVDAGLTYDGRNTSATTITVTGGTTWDSPEVLTLTASTPIFLATDVTNQNQITFVNGNVTYRFDISGFTSSTVVSAIPTKMVGVNWRNVARTDWRFARKTFRNLNHLEGKTLAVLSEGNYVPGLVVANGMVTLPRAGAVVHLGLPYSAEIETLDMAQPAGQTKAKSVNIPRLFLTVQESRAVFVATTAYGTSGDLVADKFVEIKQRNPSMGYDPAIPAETDVFEVLTNGSWSNKGRIAIRQPYPLPITINCITQEAIFGLG